MLGQYLPQFSATEHSKHLNNIQLGKSIVENLLLKTCMLYTSFQNCSRPFVNSTPGLCSNQLSITIITTWSKFGIVQETGDNGFLEQNVQTLNIGVLQCDWAGLVQHMFQLIMQRYPFLPWLCWRILLISSSLGLEEG